MSPYTTEVLDCSAVEIRGVSPGGNSAVGSVLKRSRPIRPLLRSRSSSSEVSRGSCGAS